MKNAISLLLLLFVGEGFDCLLHHLVCDKSYITFYVAVENLLRLFAVLCVIWHLDHDDWLTFFVDAECTKVSFLAGIEVAEHHRHLILHPFDGE